MPNTEELNALANLTPEEIRLAAGDEPTLEPDPAPAPELRQEPAIPLKVSVPPNAGEMLQQITAYEENLAAKFDDGDITAREFRAEMERARAEREALTWQFKKADLAREMQETAERASWEREVSDFMTTGPGAAIARSHGLTVAFDNIVRQVTADPATQHLSDRAQLELAWRRYQEDVGRAGAGVGLDVAQSLGAMGGGYRDDGGLHSQLDRMAMNGDVSGIERALSRMTPAERDQYGY